MPGLKLNDVSERGHWGHQTGIHSFIQATDTHLK